MFNQLPDNIKSNIYDYDPTYKHIYNIVLEEFKIKCALKFKHKFNNCSIRRWSKKIALVNLEETNIIIKKDLLNDLQEQLNPITDEAIIKFTKALNKEKTDRTYIIYPQLRPTPTAFGISIFKII